MPVVFLVIETQRWTDAQTRGILEPRGYRDGSFPFFRRPLTDVLRAQDGPPPRKIYGDSMVEIRANVPATALSAGEKIREPVALAACRLVDWQK